MTPAQRDAAIAEAHAAHDAYFSGQSSIPDDINGSEP